METPPAVKRVGQVRSAPEKSVCADLQKGSDSAPIKFGSFSLGDVLEKEIQKFGRFAFRSKHSKGESSKRFVEDFVKLGEGCNGGTAREGGRCFEFGVEGSDLGSNGESGVGRPNRRNTKPVYPYGSCIEHLYEHSWSNPGGTWIWVEKGKGLTAAEQGGGFPARRAEIWRFGGRSRRVVRVAARQVDERSFAEVVLMEQGRSFGQNRPGGIVRQGDRGALGRFNDERGIESSQDNFRPRQDLGRDGYRGQFKNQMPNYQSGGWDERARFEQNRNNNNKRAFDDRDKREWDEQELRAKLRREQDERRGGGQGSWGNQRGEQWKGKGVQMQE